ncbi:Hermansky-Pudlak syndrome 1 protein [Oncorhynchus masou masou]|uniref:Hermansky-Pudlak syndrome 1 protein n=1 Tax=Oncorhynchus masou masou TaxID=90313 RepID=UPI003183F011
MKCLLIASESAEVLFYWTDPEFELNIQEQYGASQEEGEKPPAFEDSINTLFAPIIISCSTMVDRLGDSYTSFSTENNHTYVLHQFEECLYIAVNGDREEGEEDLKRKIYVMKKMIEVLFGMVTLSSTLIRKELRPQDTEQRTNLWKYLQNLLETYSRLQEQDQSFLVEAVERLIHPTLCEQCIEFLERRLVQQINSSVERAGEEVLHAFILVHTKLLAFYSSRNASTLTSSDLLALIVMVQNMYPSNIDLEDTAPEDVENTSAPDIFYTPEPSPTNRDSGTDRDSVNSGRHEESRHEESRHEESSHEESCHEESCHEESCHVGSGTPVFQFLDPDIQMAEDSLQTLEAPPPDPSNPSRVFLEVTLKEGCYPMMPHSMYCLPLWPGITLVLLTKIPNSNLAMSVYVFLEAFAKLEKRLSEGLEGSAARGQTSIQDLRNKLDKFIRALGTSDIQTSQLQSVWTEFKSRAFTRGGPGFSKDLVPWCRTMKSQLCGVYRQCFITENTVGGGNPQRLSPSLQDRALTMVQEKLMDWKDFLLVKSKRNITMVSYLEEFPGLIHFIYVDRTAGQMIAPSLNITDRATSELGKGPLAHFIKGKVWGLVNTSRIYLQKGYSTVTLRDGDYFFCYFLWFENETGYKLEVKDLPILPNDSAPIGMLAWDYYRKLLRYYSKSHQGEVVKCYELLTVHLGVIPTEYILQHCSQLARKLWEPSRIPLL